jgi:imidazolonepropionase-like amidohydrolase
VRLLQLFSFFVVTSAAVAQITAIRNVAIIDVVSGTSRRGNIVIAGSRIVAAGPAARIPAKARIINGTGKFVLPGLWDMHVHLWESEPMFDLYTAHGITGIRDMGSDYERTRKWAKQALAGTGPRVITPGAPVDGPASEAAKFAVMRAGGPEEGRRAADFLDDRGADFIKVLSTLSRDAYMALAQRARVRRAIFAGHVPESVSISEAIDAHQRSMEHLFGIALACSSEEAELRQKRSDAIARKDSNAIREVRERTYKTFSDAKCGDLLRRMARFGVWQVPTLTLRQRLALIGLDQLVAQPAIRSVPKAIRAGWKDPRVIYAGAPPNGRTSESETSSGDGIGTTDPGPETLERFRADYEFHRNLVYLMRGYGVDLLAGTDTGDDFVIPGAALHQELALLVEAGLTAPEALRTATINPARYLNLELTHGTIARGKIADLVVLDSDPLADIRNTQRIRAVVVRGKVLDRKRLDVMLAPR